MRLLMFIIATNLLAITLYGQDIVTFKGIAVDKISMPIPYCSVSIKGTKIAATTDDCGRFRLLEENIKFTIVFIWNATHDFITFEKRIDPKKIKEGETIIFQLRNHGKIVNSGCKKDVDRSHKKIVVH